METLNWGLIGCGDIARKRVAPALCALPQSALLAVARAQADQAAEFAQTFGVPRWYADWRELLRDAEIAAVYLATPVALHAEQTIAAAEAGKHVLCEKPMALNTQDCDRMIAACAANGVQLSVAYYRRFYPVLQRCRELLTTGAIGQPVLAQVNAFERFDAVPGAPRHWLLQRAQAGGGPMMDFGCHRIELLQHLLGDITAVSSALGNVLFHEREVEDTAVALFTFASGARGVLSVTHAAFESQDTLDLFGTAGSLHLAGLNRGTLRIVDANGERTETLPPHENLHYPLIKDFAQAIRAQRPPAVTGADGRAVTQIEEKIYQRYNTQ